MCSNTYTVLASYPDAVLATVWHPFCILWSPFAGFGSSGGVGDVPHVPETESWKKRKLRRTCELFASIIFLEMSSEKKRLFFIVV